MTHEDRPVTYGDHPEPRPLDPAQGMLSSVLASTRDNQLPWNAAGDILATLRSQGWDLVLKEGP